MVILDDPRHYCPWCGAGAESIEEDGDMYQMTFECGSRDETQRDEELQSIRRDKSEVSGCQWIWPREGVLEPMARLTVLRVVKELEVLRDPEQHSVVQDMTEDQAFHRLRAALRSRRAEIANQ